MLALERMYDAAEGRSTRKGKRKLVEISFEEAQEIAEKKAKMVNNQALIEAARKGNIDQCVAAVRHGADVNFQSCGLPPLFYAAFYGHSMIIEYLVNCGALVNEKNLSGVTPLAKAIDSGHADAASCLLRHGADPNVADQTGTTPLIKATRNGRADLVRCLVEGGGARVDAQNLEKATALHEASLKGNKEIVDILLQAGAKPDVVNQQGKTALHRAVSGNHLSVMRSLLDRGANINTQDSLGYTTLHYAAFFGFEDSVRLLIERGANRNLTENVHHRTPLQVALERRHFAVSEYLSRIEDVTIPDCHNACHA